MRAYKNIFFFSKNVHKKAHTYESKINVKHRPKLFDAYIQSIQMDCNFQNNNKIGRYKGQKKNYSNEIERKSFLLCFKLQIKLIL